MVVGAGVEGVEVGLDVGVTLVGLSVVGLDVGLFDVGLDVMGAGVEVGLIDEVTR